MKDSGSQDQYYDLFGEETRFILFVNTNPNHSIIILSQNVIYQPQILSLWLNIHT